MRTRFWSLLCLGSVALLTGCFSTGPKFDAYERNAAILTNFANVNLTNTIQPEWLKPSEAPYVLGPGDIIDVEVLGDATTRAALRLGPDGKVYYQLLPGLDVWGLTLSQAKTLLEKEMAKYVNQPQVLVSLRGVGSKYVWLMGRVTTPGVYPLTAPMTVLEAIAMAGGSMVTSTTVTTEELADLRHSFVVRQGQVLPVDFYRLIRQGDMTQNIYLQSEDFVFIPSAIAQEIYVLGAVRQPRAVGYRDELTLVSVVAAAAGTIPTAYLSHVAIIRGSLSQPQIAIVDFDAILKGQAADVRLEPRDIVYVPFTPFRYLMKYADLVLSTFVNTVAANEGIRAVNSSGTAVGVSVSPFSN